MANEAENLQAIGAMLQAGTSLVDSFLNIGGLLSNAAQALYLLKSAGSEMDTMVPKMNAILISAQKIFRKYWSSKKRFEEWIKLVTDTCKSAEKLSLDYRGIKRFCAPAVMTRDIQKICDKIDRCIEEGKALEDALLRRAIKRVVKFRNLINITDVETLNKPLRSILEKLDSERSLLINLYGEFGTGKRVILEHLNNDKAIVRNKYDIVIWVSTSYIENPDKNSNIVAGIQRIIAERLGLDIQGNNDVNTIAEKIHAELKGAKYLMLLDDVKDIFDVNAIGLPRNDNGSKIVITTIYPFVFEVEKPTIFVKSGRLVGGESWQMFRNLLKKDNLLKDHDIEKIARKVVTWCDHHFLLIKIAAENFKSEDTAESWVSCFNMLKGAPRKGDGYMRAMEKILQLGYKTLTEKQKLCFLFCALYPKENGSFGGKIPIHCLFDCWAALKFLDYDNKVENLSPGGHRILESLIKKSLLNKDPNKQYVIMSKLFRGVAIHYLEQDGQLTKGYVAIEKLEEEKLDDCTTIQWLSLANCNIQFLPTMKRFGKVTALFLQKNSKLENVPMGFIEHMNELQVLDLHKTGIKSIFSIRNLRNLKVLYVNSCNLLQSFSVGKEGLDELEVLDIRGIVVRQIPDDIKKLKKLRRLMISISGGCNLDLLYISGIPGLKELIVDVKSDSASKEKDYNHNSKVTRIIKSIHNLDELCTLQFHFEDVVVPVIKVVGTFSKISVPNLESLVHLLEGKAILEHENLEVCIGLEPNVEISTLIHVKNSFIRPSGKNGRKYESGTIYSNVQTLILIKDDSFCDMSTSTSNMNNIHSCLIYECNKAETIMQTAGFSSLKILILSKCSALKVLFSNNTLLEMGIEHLEIRDCPVIEDIDIGGGVVFPCLMTLVLYNLPELKLERSLMKWPLLKTSRMHRCGNMTKLPFKVDGPTNLRVIEVEQTWWDEKLRLSDSIKMRFVDYCKFSCKRGRSEENILRSVKKLQIGERTETRVESFTEKYKMIEME